MNNTLTDEYSQINYSILFHAIQNSYKLDYKAKMVYNTLITQTNTDDKAEISVDLLALFCGFSRSTIQRAIKDLVNIGLVIKKRTLYVNVYEITPCTQELFEDYNSEWWNNPEIVEKYFPGVRKEYINSLYNKKKSLTDYFYDEDNNG